MTDQTVVSVVIPVYGVEPYLDHCIRSVVEQDYERLDIVVVDDGSPDDCPQMCDEWAARDPRIRVVHKKNGGLASARNAGLDVIVGDVVTFVDSDDYVEPNYVSELLRWHEQSGADVVMCSCMHDLEDGSIVTDKRRAPGGTQSGISRRSGNPWPRGRLDRRPGEPSRTREVRRPRAFCFLRLLPVACSIVPYPHQLRRCRRH